MVERKVSILRTARLIAAISLFSALAIIYGVGGNYLDYLAWTQGARVNLIRTLGRSTPDGTGELLLEIDFQAPDVGYRTDTESLEFTLRGPEGSLGYYRVIIPPNPGSKAEHDVPQQLSLACPIPIEHWPNLLKSSAPRVDGRLIVRLYLPGREVPTRVPISAPVSLEGGWDDENN